jgi:hypothetical protein|tara:strand:- start:3815 stop:3985 length:171 start_codon:yes stop_codon:yes gene_type:complete
MTITYKEYIDYIMQYAIKHGYNKVHNETYIINQLEYIGVKYVAIKGVSTCIDELRQ